MNNLRFPIHQSIKGQLRAEMYNAFNHTQFGALDNGARFDPKATR